MDEIILSLAAPRGGYFFRGDALAAGFDDRFLRTAMRAGLLRRIRHGTYVPTVIIEQGTPHSNFLILAQSVLDRLGPAAVLSFDSAMYAHTGISWGLDLSRVHVTRLDGRHPRREAGVVSHIGRTTEDDVVWIDGLPVMNPSRTVIEVASSHSVEVAMVHSSLALNAGLVEIDDLYAGLTDMKHWPGMNKARLAVEYAEPKCESVGEVRSMYHFRRHHVPLPEPQVVIFDDAGRFVARVDFDWAAYRHVGEFDGHGKYGTDADAAARAVIKEKWREDGIRATARGASRWGWVHLSRPSELAARIQHDLDRSHRIFVAPTVRR